MLNEISIQNLAIIDKLTLPLQSGMTVITGETGAGKSILLDAVQLALGSRGNTQQIRPNQEKIDISLHFDVTNLPEIQAQLQAQELDAEELCVLRRTLHQNGRSRAYINAQTVPLGRIRDLGESLLTLHGQHEHHLLLRADAPRQLLDAYGGHLELASQLQKTYQSWQKQQKVLHDLHEQQKTEQAEQELLRYQAQELDTLSVQDGEWQHLDQTHKEQAQAEHVIAAIDAVLQQLTGDENATMLAVLDRSLQSLKTIKSPSVHIQNAQTLVEQARVNLEEANTDLQTGLEQIEIDPQALQKLEQRIAEVHQMARKHHVEPRALFGHHQQLNKRLHDFGQNEQALSEQENACEREKKRYLDLAAKLSKARKKTAKKMAIAVSEHLRQLNLPHAQFEVHCVSLASDQLSPHGAEQVQFHVSTNPGMPMGPLHKVASGGELSRISLAIAVVTASCYPTPVLIFDEVDTGIGGATAEKVGQQLQQLGKHAQVLCITHLAQIAALADQHLKVEKTTEDGQTISQIKTLTKQERIQEIARMMGGEKITKATLAHAESLISA